MKVLRKFQLLIAVLASMFVLSVPALALAQTPPATTPTTPAPSGNQQAVCDGIGLTGGSCATDPNPQINNVITNVINIFSLIIGVAAVIMIMVGGFKYVSSTGDSNSINSAKNTIMYALIGLVIVALAQVIVKFTLNKATTAPPANQTTPTTPAPGTPTPGTP
jgi:hypothetical protein